MAPDENNLFPKRGLQQATILADWIRALQTFKGYYTELAPYVNPDEQRSGVRQDWGQCPPDLVERLVLRMQEVLKDLLDDFVAVAPFLPALDDHRTEKLVTHTKVLNNINQQARVIRHLLKQTPM